MVASVLASHCHPEDQHEQLVQFKEVAFSGQPDICFLFKMTIVCVQLCCYNQSSPPWEERLQRLRKQKTKVASVVAPHTHHHLEKYNKTHQQGRNKTFYCWISIFLLWGLLLDDGTAKSRQDEQFTNRFRSNCVSAAHS